MILRYVWEVSDTYCNEVSLYFMKKKNSSAWRWFSTILGSFLSNISMNKHWMEICAIRYLFLSYSYKSSVMNCASIFFYDWSELIVSWAMSFFLCKVNIYRCAQNIQVFWEFVKKRDGQLKLNTLRHWFLVKKIEKMFFIAEKIIIAAIIWQ